MDDVIRTSVGTVAVRDRASPAYQAYQILHFAFVAAPTIAGLDKFFHLLTNWDDYLAPAIARALPFSGHAFMLLVGLVEVIAGLVVAVKPKIGAYVVAAWLGGIMVDLVMRGHALDIVLRDFGLFLAALALGRLAAVFDVAQKRPVQRPARA